MGTDIVATIGVMIPIFALLIPIIALLMQPYKIRAKQHAQDEARKSYERLVLEKLDVMKTAITMGYKKDELADLDQRLERVIGADKLQALITEKQPVPVVNTEILDSDLLSEMDRIREKTKLKT